MKLLSPNLQAFLTICELGTAVAAAKRLRVGQTALTQRIKNLEAEVGATLFQRSNSGMSPTAEGRALLRHCLETRESERRALGEIAGGGVEHDVELVLAGPTSFISSRAILPCIEVLRKWPRLNLRFAVDDGADRSPLLKNRGADLAVLYPHQVLTEFESCELTPDEYLLVCTPAWRKRPLHEILAKERLYAFHPDDATSLNYLKAYHLHKYVTRPRLYANENRTLIELLRQGIGYGLLEKAIAAPFLKEKSLHTLNEGKTLKDRLVLAWYARTWMTGAFREVLGALRSA